MRSKLLGFAIGASLAMVMGIALNGCGKDSNLSCDTDEECDQSVPDQCVDGRMVDADGVGYPCTEVAQ
jgi:hypothetical protein